MPEIKGLPEIKDYPGANPLRVAILKALRGAASDPTAIEVGPLGMTRALKGTKLFHGTPEKGFTYFAPKKAGSGAGAVYGKGINLSEHPAVAKFWGALAGDPLLGAPVVRTQNLPPQAKILDIHAPLTGPLMQSLKERGSESVRKVLSAYERGSAESLTLEHLLDNIQVSHNEVKKLVQDLGYDGISLLASRMSALPPGVPKNTRNLLIYNYDIINKPRSLVPKTKPQPEKALTRYPSPRFTHLEKRRIEARKAREEARIPTREEVMEGLRRQGYFIGRGPTGG